MRKISTICMSLLMAVSLQVSAAGKTTEGQNLRKLPAVPVSVQGFYGQTSAAQQSVESGLVSGVKYAPERVSEDADTQKADSYGWVMGPDGYYWHYTMDLDAEQVRELYPGVYEYKYNGAKVKVYDNYNKEVGSFDIKVPENIFCNRIQLYGPVTKKLFDKNDQTYEIMCDIHHAKNGDNYSITRAYSIKSGEILFDKKGTGIILDASKNSYDTFQRFLLTNEDQEGADGKYYTHIELYKNGGWGEDPYVLEQEIDLDQDLLYYMQGSYLNFYKVNDKPYMVFAQYEKPWELERDSEDMNDVKQRPDNHLVLKTYGYNNKQWELVNTISVDGNCPEGYGHRTIGFGALGYNDLSQGLYTNDGKFNYVIAAYDYVTSKDADVVTFSVYNQDGEKVKDIIKNASSSWWNVLSSVPGKEDQIAFLQSIGDGDAASEQITLIDVPSCKQATVLPYEVEGNKISTTLDRKATNANDYGYQYVVSLAQGEADSQDNVIAPIAWINPDGHIDHKDALNLGTNGEYFTPLLNEVSLNPYLFDTDDKMEYVYLAKKRRTDGSNKIDNVLEVAKADGTVIRSWESSDEKRIVQPSIIPVNEDGKYVLALVFANNTTGLYEISYVDLPLTQFAAGGDGSAEKPYLVSSAGDLMQMAQYKSANFKLANDIDMTEAGLWNPVDNFTGVLDGDNHSIFNLYVNSDKARAGLFGTLSYGGQVKNVNFISPTIELTSNNQFVGIVAGNCSTDAKNGTMKINAAENVHVIDGNIFGNGDATIGGIIGQTALYGDVVSCSYQGDINTPNASTAIGGIVGSNCTASKIYACSSNLNAVAGANLGGILGKYDSQSGDVYNCISQGKLTAKNTVGGIAGASNRSKTYNNISRCDIYASEPSKFYGYSVGGIIGNLDQNPKATENSVPGSSDVVYDNVATGTIYINGAKYDGSLDKKNTVHAIVGYSSDDYEITQMVKVDDGESYDEVIGNAVEDGLHHNYTTSNLATNTDAAKTEGKYVALGDLKKDFFVNADNFATPFTYGTTAATPWKGDNIPVLYFNDEPKAITISAQKVTLGLNAPDTYIQVVVYGVEDAEDIEVASSAPNVAEVSIESIDGNVATLKVHALKMGVAKVNISYAGFSSSCDVTVYKEIVNGIENVETANDFQVSMANGYIAAEGAKTILVYSVGGQLVAKSNGAAISTAQLAKGIYVVNATSAAGQKSTAKFVVK